MSDNIGGMLVTSHDAELDYFKPPVLINSRLCNKTAPDDRARQKITGIHPYGYRPFQE
jgi:hypothetical protein